jgi:hypothetical protein
MVMGAINYNDSRDIKLMNESKKKLAICRELQIIHESIHSYHHLMHHLP